MEITKIRNKILFLICTLSVITACDNEETEVDEVTLLTGNDFKAWEVTNIAYSDEHQTIDKCHKDNVWEFVQEGWKYVNWKLEIKPGFLKCNLEEQSTHWHWKFNADFTQLYLTSIDDPNNNFVIKYDIITLEEDEMVLEQIAEDPWGLDFNRISITLKAKN